MEGEGRRNKGVKGRRAQVREGVLNDDEARHIPPGGASGAAEIGKHAQDRPSNWKVRVVGSACQNFAGNRPAQRRMP